MGNWSVVITGVGPHHNNKPIDVEKIVEKAVQELKDNGHYLEYVSVVAGGKADVKLPETK